MIIIAFLATLWQLLQLVLFSFIFVGSPVMIPDSAAAALRSATLTAPDQDHAHHHHHHPHPHDMLLNDDNLQRRLLSLNKPALTSIQSPDRDIIDCIPIDKQVALDHPLLKDHKVQMSPTSFPLEDRSFSRTTNKGGEIKKEQPLRQLWHNTNDSCPSGFISVRRTTKEDLQRESLHKQAKYKNILTPKIQDKKQESLEFDRHEYAFGQASGHSFYGANGIFNLWSPRVGSSGEFSIAQLWLFQGSYREENLNTIEVGWQVWYGKNYPQLFVYWTRDAYKETGCYNLQCSGFVQISSRIVLGGALSHVSIIDGQQQELNILVFREPSTGDWWLSINGEYVGYWPKSIYTLLQKHASTLQWGGEIVNDQENGQHTTTQMGSGMFAKQGLKKSAYIRNLQFVNFDFTYETPSGLIPIITNAPCYDLELGNSSDWGLSFFFGGPGKNPACP